MRVAFVGNSIVANMGALYLRKLLPEDVEIFKIGPTNRGGIPMVGESTIEITAQFLENKLGLAQYLRKKHCPKYALTYYFKLDPENPDDRSYSVHCNEREPRDLPPLEGWTGPMARPPSWQLNRHVFDKDLKVMAEEAGIFHIDGQVKNIEIDRYAGHTMTIQQAHGENYTFTADWVIDTSGRACLLGKKFGLIQKPAQQRNVFWFRLADFDRSILSDINALGPMPAGTGESYHYDRYYSTHHFMGHGNWIWMIPLRSEDNSKLISIGLTYRPDIYEYNIRSVNDFVDCVAKVHPVVSDFVASGQVVDTNMMHRYHYIAKQVYSSDRWGIAGDAACAPDPLFSNGLAFSTIQLEQLGALIQRDLEGEHEKGFAERLSTAFLGPVLNSQSAISHWYATMGDPFLSALRLNWIEISYFYMLLPMVVNRCHYEPKGLELWRLLQNTRRGRDVEIPKALLDLRAKIDQVHPEFFVYQGKEKINPRALEQVSSTNEIRKQIVEGSALQRKYYKDVISQVHTYLETKS